MIVRNVMVSVSIMFGVGITGSTFVTASIFEGVKSFAINLDR
jgi:hypothetical protein